MNERRIEFCLMQVLLAALGIAAVGVGAMVFLTGVQFIHMTEAAFNFATGQPIPIEPLTISPTLDNEFRFYAIFWLSYGALLLRVARNLLTQLRFVPMLMGIFFLGGAGRALSNIFIGAPHPAFIMLMVVEFALPIVVAILYARVHKLDEPDQTKIPTVESSKRILFR